MVSGAVRLPPFQPFHFGCLLSDAIREFSEGKLFEDEALKCYMHCLFEHGGLINDKGQIEMEVLLPIVEQLSEENQQIMMRMGRSCTKRPSGKTNCDRAFSLNKCWKMADPQVREIITLLLDLIGCSVFSALFPCLMSDVVHRQNYSF